MDLADILYPNQGKDPYDYSDQYNTQLSAEDEAKFQTWAKEQGREKDVYDYDLRGFWKAGEEFADNGHGSDQYKKPNHPTFSDQSKYSSPEQMGGKWTEDKKGTVTFTPSEQNLKMMGEENLRKYFAEHEPDVILNIPKKGKK